ncbi:MAG: NAD+ synthase [Candidatus Micrarchaeota archaeon]
MNPQELEKKIQEKLKITKASEEKLVSSLRAYFKKCKRQSAVVGLSGGVDSSLVCYLASKALSPENIFAYHMPYVQDEQDEEDVKQLVKMLGVNYQKHDIRSIVDRMAETFKPRTRIASGNIRVRTRMIALYDFAHTNEALVLGTGNRTELLLGYFTKYGDGATDLMPIGHLYKTQVWDLARLSKLPERIIEKVPTAGMWAGQTDEKEIGVPYAEIDRILVSHFDLNIGWDELTNIIQEKKVRRVQELYESSEHKRRMPDVLVI